MDGNLARRLASELLPAERARVRRLAAPDLPDGFVAFVKRECPTCQLVAPVLRSSRLRRASRSASTPGRRGFPRASRASTTLRSLRRGITRSRPCRRCCASRTASRSNASSAGSGEWESLTGVAGLAPICPRGDRVAGRSRRSRSRARARRAFRRGALRARRVEVPRAKTRSRPPSSAAGRWIADRPAHREARARDARRTSRDPRNSSRRCRPIWCRARREGRDQRGDGGCKPEYLPVVLAPSKPRAPRVQHARPARDHDADRPC